MSIVMRCRSDEDLAENERLREAPMPGPVVETIWDKWPLLWFMDGNIFEGGDRGLDSRHCTYWMWRHRLAGWFVCPWKGHDYYPDMCGRPEHDICERCEIRRYMVKR